MQPGQQDKTILPDLRQHHKVRVYNPLTYDFTVSLARSINQLDPKYRDPHIDQLRLRNQAHPTMQHVTQTVTVKSKEAYNLPGDAAQIFVKKLIDACIDEQFKYTDEKTNKIKFREGRASMHTNPDERLKWEKLIVTDYEDLLAQVETMDIQDQLDKQLADLNTDPSDTKTDKVTKHEEQAFPDLGTGEPVATDEQPGTGRGRNRAAATA